MPGVARRIRPSSERGQAMVEMALVFPLLLIVAIGLVQFALYAHAENVVTGAAQDGARVAAEGDRTLADGVNHTRAVLQAGLGTTAADVTVAGSDGGDVVVIEVTGRLRAIIPWVADATLPLHARAIMSKERFRVGPAETIAP